MDKLLIGLAVLVWCLMGFEGLYKMANQSLSPQASCVWHRRDIATTTESICPDRTFLVGTTYEPNGLNAPTVIRFCAPIKCD